jgi:hypothetical protein
VQSQLAENRTKLRLYYKTITFRARKDRKWCLFSVTGNKHPTIGIKFLDVKGLDDRNVSFDPFYTGVFAFNEDPRTQRLLSGAQTCKNTSYQRVS